MKLLIFYLLFKCVQTKGSYTSASSDSEPSVPATPWSLVLGWCNQLGPRYHSADMDKWRLVYSWSAFEKCRSERV